MTQATVSSRAPLSTVTAVDTAIDTVSGVSWAAVFAGAFVAAAFFLALVALGAGIGLVSVSPWSSNNPSVTTFTLLAAAWFIAVQLFASGVGGYIAGRLRSGWARGPISLSRREFVALTMWFTFPAVRTTPFGSPEVPEV